MQSVPITTNVVSLNPTHVEVYSIQHYVIKFVSDLRQVGGLLWALRFPPPIKLTATIYITEIMLEMALTLNTIYQTQDHIFSETYMIPLRSVKISWNA